MLSVILPLNLVCLEGQLRVKQTIFICLLIYYYILCQDEDHSPVEKNARKGRNRGRTRGQKYRGNNGHGIF